MTCRDACRRNSVRKPAGSGVRVSSPALPGRTWHGATIPTDTIPHFPPGACGCGRDLTQATDLGVHASHQVTDIPADIQAQTIQHDRHAVKCVCGQVHVAPPPGGVTGAPGTVTYGLRLQAWCVFLMVMHHVPVQRCADILQSLTGTRPSDGWVHALLERAARGVATANKLIRTLIILASVICGDEPPIRAGPAPRRARSTCWSRARTCSLITSWAAGTWAPSTRSCCPT